MKIKIAGIITIIFFTVGRICFAYGEGEVSEQVGLTYDDTGWLVNGEIVYPVTPEDEQWEDLFLESEREAACRIPDDIISKLDTYTLLKAALDYPMFGTLYIYGDEQTGFKMLLQKCNALKELMERDDCLEVAKQFYSDYSVPQKAELNYSEAVKEESYAEDMNALINDLEMRAKVRTDARAIYMCDLLELILAGKSNELTDDECEEVFEIVLEKIKEKGSSEVFSNAGGSLFVAEMEKNSASVYSAVEKDDNGTYIWTNIRTPSGKTTIKVKEYTYARTCDVAQYASEISELPGAQVITSASITFNCHSYAWLSDMYPKKFQYYTLDYVPAALSGDPVYKKETFYNHSGEIVHWNNGWHSARLVGTATYEFTTPNGNKYYSPKVIAKWGAGPMVFHYLNGWNGLEQGVTYYYK